MTTPSSAATLWQKILERADEIKKFGVYVVVSIADEHGKPKEELYRDLIKYDPKKRDQNFNRAIEKISQMARTSGFRLDPKRLEAINSQASEWLANWQKAATNTAPGNCIIHFLRSASLSANRIKPFAPNQYNQSNVQPYAVGPNPMQYQQQPYYQTYPYENAAKNGQYTGTTNSYGLASQYPATGKSAIKSDQFGYMPRAGSGHKKWRMKSPNVRQASYGSQPGDQPHPFTYPPANRPQYE